MNRRMKAKVFSGTKNPEISERERAGHRIARAAAAEGIVLLKNDGILPVCKEKPLALLGAGAGKTRKGGTGSGDVCERFDVSVYEGMKEAGFTITSEDWVHDYDQRYDTARQDWKKMILEESEKEGSKGFFDVYTSHAFEVPVGREITEEDFNGADLAVYVISRVAGEGSDRSAVAGDYELTEYEIYDLQVLAEMKKDIVVLLNIGGLIDLKLIEANPAVKAIAYISQPGMSGGHAVADVLSGTIAPSGKLTDTWAVSYSDYPNHATFSHCNGNVITEKYEEGLFVGYRYFDTYEIPVQYCFGHGLSYTEFEIASAGDIQADENALKLSFTVKNVGNAAGKEVVQVYAALPEGGLTKEFRRLAGFEKTGLLQPGDTETVTVTIDAKQLAVFDESQCAWILEAGKYVLLAGNSLEDAGTTAVVTAQKTIILEKTHAICPLQEELEELAGKEARRAERLGALLEICRDKNVPEIAFAPEEREMPVCRKSVAATEAAELVEKLTTEELIALCVGEVSHGHDVAFGGTGIMVPGAAGESSAVLEESYGIPGIAMADGPAGIRILKSYMADEVNKKVYTRGFLGAMEQGFFAPPMERPEGTVEYYQYCTAFPIGTMLAQTWNRELQEAVGRHVGVEMEELGISWWLAPGMNIHRNPLCGRNFEYFAEDPLVSGKTAAAITRGVQSIAGVGTTIKHFCANNQEDNRFGSNSVMSTRVLREIYLRGFEIAVRESQPMSVMSSYNLINGVHTANCEDILLTVLRKEWGFRGFVMTDWTTTSNGSVAWKCTQGGNDLIMPGCPEDFVSIREGLESGELTMEELKASVTRLLTVVLQTNAFEDAVAYRYI